MNAASETQHGVFAQTDTLHLQFTLKDPLFLLIIILIVNR